MTGNELFDLYSLNSGTRDSSKNHFNQEFSSLLTHAKTKGFKNVFRKNFLRFSNKLKLFGFNEIKQFFSHWQKMLPPIANIKYKDDLFMAREKINRSRFRPK